MFSDYTVEYKMDNDGARNKVILFYSHDNYKYGANRQRTKN